MKIQNVKTIETASHKIISAKCTIRKFGSDQVYFKINKKYSDFVFSDASPFAAALLLPSMKQGENLIINGKISKKLYTGMHKIMNIVSKWNIGLKPIKIIADEVIEDKEEPSITASFFSGGIDSFYTYFKHKKDSQNSITHKLLVRGFDIDLSNKKLWNTTRDNIKKIAAKEKTDVIEIESNIRPLIEPILSWDYTHGGCLAAVALCLRKKIKKIYIASSHTYKKQTSRGSNIKTDKLWGTENLSIIHDGVESTRIKKTIKIADEPTVLKYLKSCYINMNNSYNCGSCEKCLRTMTGLFIAGTLHKSKTFPKKIDPLLFSNIKSHQTIKEFHYENLKELKSRNLMPDLQNALKKLILQTKPEAPISIKQKILIFVVYVDHVFTKGLFRRLAFSFIN